MVNDSEGVLGKIPEGVESLAELMLWDSDVNVYQENKVVIKEEAFTIRGKKQKTKMQKEAIMVERRAQARAKYEAIKKEQNQRIQDAPLSIMKDDFAFRTNRPDEMIYRPDYKPAEELELEEKVTGLKGVTDFDAFAKRVKQKKKAAAEQSRIARQQQSMNASSAAGLGYIPSAEAASPD